MLAMSQTAEKIFLRVSPELKEKWLAATESTGQTSAGANLIEWVCSLDPDLQKAIFSGDGELRERLVGPAIAKMAMMEMFNVRDLDTLDYQQLCDLIEAATAALEKQIKALRREVTGRMDPDRKRRK